ncbi:MAG: hypothetical protein PF569_07020 [Candidatus Woesearchaeota archaeon]|jgi:hypothetical protein|nr:hypothetical protein [Candidatus Woesearchaeota archaeon]
MKKIILILVVSLFVLSGCSNSTQEVIVNNDLIPTSGLFLKILETNDDGLEYLEKHNDTKVVDFKKIKPIEFEELKNQTQYKELYLDLPQKDLYYVEFSSSGSTLSLITIIDLEKEEVIKIFGVLIMGMG